MWSWGDCYLVSVVLGVGLWSLGCYVFSFLYFFWLLRFCVSLLLTILMLLMRLLMLLCGFGHSHGYGRC